MKNLILFLLLVTIAGLGVCHAQGPFKNKHWFCFKTVNHGEMVADRKYGDSHGINSSGTPEFKFYYDFRNNETQGGQHFTYYNGRGGIEFQGTWNYSGQTLTINRKDYAPAKYQVVLFSDDNFLILKDNLGIWYYFGNGD
jgi:hypothetical protein